MAQAIVNTDTILAPGNYFKRVIIRVTNFGSKNIIHFATQNLAIQGGFPSNQDNTGGRFGWLAFGLRIQGVTYFLPPQPINYQAQLYVAPQSDLTVCRIWLEPFVEIDSEVEQINTVLQTLTKVADQVTPLLLRGRATVSNGNTLPVRVP